MEEAADGNVNPEVVRDILGCAAKTVRSPNDEDRLRSGLFCTMDEKCVVLMPRVCEVLAGLEKPLHDDTSLEKLLDWFTGLTRDGSLLEVCPCLPVFIDSVIHNTTADPSVISFTLKLTGLLAASEVSFKLLREQSILRLGYNRQHWQESGLWEDPCVRIGWIQGLRSMLQHPMALHFLVETELTKTLLQLQTDTSLFVASAANQLLVHVLVFFQPVSSEVHADVERKQKDGLTTDTEIERLVLAMETSPEYTAVTTAILEHLRTSLVPKENGHRHNLQNLKLLALVFAQARPPLRGTLLRMVPGSLEALVTAGNSQLTLPLMDVLLTACSCPDPNDQEVSRLLSAMLDTHNPCDLIHAAAAVLLRDHHDSVHTIKAVRILLLPLDVLTGLSLLDPQAPEDQRSSMAELLISKRVCISILCVCLAHTAHITLRPADLPSPPVSVIMAILSLLRISGGHAPSSSICTSKAHRNVIGCGKIQKCGLEALTALSSSPGAKEKMWEVLTVLVQYLQNPDSEATVLQKCYQTLVKWLSVCTDISSMSDQLRQDLQTAVWKRVCDIRWEVRDSTVEFLGQLAAESISPEALLGRSTTPLLVEALCDQESYVRASAISALAQTMARSWQQGAEVTHEQTDIVSRLLDILSQDTEGFPRRAVVQYFISWFSARASDAPLPPLNLAPSSLLTSSVRTILAQGSADLDWEVKGHTLELARLLLDVALPDGRQKAGDSRVTHPFTVASDQAHTPPHAHPPGETHTEPENGVSEDAGSGSSSLAGVLQRLVKEGLVTSLLSGLFDCDRPVALKACQLLITLRETVCPPPTDRTATAAAVAAVTCELQAWGWGNKIVTCLWKSERWEPGTTGIWEQVAFEVDYDDSDDSEMAMEGVACVSVCKVLRCLGLEKRMAVLTQSSDHVQNSPLSLLQDILTATDTKSHSDTLEVIVDCY